MSTTLSLALLALACSLLLVGAHDANCGKLNVLFVGFPAYHPAVINQGWDPVKVDKGLKSQLKELVAAGYNTKEVWNGPEHGSMLMNSSIAERRWDGVIIGFGVRGGNSLEVTQHFESLVNSARVLAPQAVLMFNYNPTSTLESVQRGLPLGDCSTHPGTNYGEHITCADDVCSTAPPGWTSHGAAKLEGEL